MNTILPDSFGAWHYCITVQCGIPLTESFIQSRLAELEQADHPQTQLFTRLYGAGYTQQVISWFRQALPPKNKSILK